MSRFCPIKDAEALYLECLECDSRSCEKPSFYCLIAGTRTYDDYDKFNPQVNYFLQNHPLSDVVIISGGATGVDAMAKKYAREHGCDYKEFPAEWSVFGKRAGYLRNRKMHEYISHFPKRGVLLFWDGKSKGTAQSIGLAESFRNPVRIVQIPVRGAPRS